MMEYAEREAERQRHRLLSTDSERVREGTRALLPDDSYIRIAETFRALADSSRAKILEALLHQELCTSDLAAIIGLSEPAVSQHLRLLRTLRVVRSHRHGHRVFYALDDEWDPARTRPGPWSAWWASRQGFFACGVPFVVPGNRPLAPAGASVQAR